MGDTLNTPYRVERDAPLVVDSPHEPFPSRVMMHFKDDATNGHISDLLEGFARMLEVMAYIRRYEFGLDLGSLGPDAPDFGLVAEFDSEEAWRENVDDIEHQRLVTKVGELSAGMARMQYRLGD